MITNIRNAAKYLGIGERTVYNLIEEKLFPEPKEIIDMGGGKILRTWKEEDLDKFRSEIRCRGQRRDREKARQNGVSKRA
jgi:predicted DNA-binding transcriptional regulator AlpA